MEYIEIYDRNRNYLNKTVSRGTELEIGEYRLAVSVIIINKNLEVLTTLRSKTKKSYPNKWENTTGGVVAGEDMKKAAVREVFEETGIIIDELDLIKLKEFESGHLLFDTFVVFKDITIEDVVLDQVETVDVKFVSIEEFEQMMANDEVLEPQTKAYETFKDELKILIRIHGSQIGQRTVYAPMEIEKVSINTVFPDFEDTLRLKEKYGDKLVVANKSVDDLIESLHQKVNVRVIDFEKEYQIQKFMCKSNALGSFKNQILKYREDELEIVGFEVIVDEKSLEYFENEKCGHYVLFEKKTKTIFTSSNKLNLEFMVELGLDEIDIKTNDVRGYLLALEELNNGEEL